jgi:hypothetical protein
MSKTHWFRLLYTTIRTLLNRLPVVHCAPVQIKTNYVAFSPQANYTQPLTEISTISIKIMFLGSKAAAGAYGWQPYRHLWADCLDNVGSLTSYNPIGLHGLLRDSFTFTGFWYLLLRQKPRYRTMKNGVFWDVTPYGSCKNRRFGET